MASIFTRALRTQARITLVASKARVVPSMPTFFGLASRRALPSFSARSLSTSQVLRDYDDVREPLQPSETLYLGNLPFAAGKEDLQALLGDFGNIKAIRMGLRPDGASKGFAHVEFEEKESAVKVFETHNDSPLYLIGRGIRVDYAPPQIRTATEPYHKLYVHDFPRGEQDLRDMFVKYDANVLSVYLLRDRDGELIGNGFIEFDTIAQATEALNELNGRELEYGVKLNLSYARPPRKSGSSRSHGGDWEGQRKSSDYNRGGGGGYRGGGGYGGGRGGGGRGRY